MVEKQNSLKEPFSFLKSAGTLGGMEAVESCQEYFLVCFFQFPFIYLEHFVPEMQSNHIIFNKSVIRQ